jgi:hypothetical protein
MAAVKSRTGKTLLEARASRPKTRSAVLRPSDHAGHSVGEATGER